MKKIGICLFLLIVCLIVIIFMNNQGGKIIIKSPITVTVFPTGTNEESYMIKVLEDGTIETLLGERKAFQIDESEYSSDSDSIFVKIDSIKTKKLNSKEIKTINKLINNVKFSNIQTERLVIHDSWERMLLIDFNAYYIYGNEEEDASLTKLINQIVDYSPIKVDMHGWA